MDRSVFVLGFDAAEASLVQRGIHEGWMPVMAELVRGGSSVRLESSQPVFPGGVWATTLTGTGVEEHLTILDRQLQPGTYNLLDVGAHDMRRPPFWQHLSRTGLRCTVASIYGAPLVEGLNGIQVSGWGSLDPESMKRDASRSDPPDVLGDLHRISGRRDPGDHIRTPRGTRQLRRYRQRLLQGVRDQTTGLGYLMHRNGWDFFMSSLNDVHPAGHLLWHLVDPSHPAHDGEAAGELEHALVDIYRATDAAIGKLIAELPASTTIFVLTPHGMGPNPAPGNALEVLLERGEWLKRAPSRSEVEDPRKAWLRSAWKTARRLVPERARPLVSRFVPRPGAIADFSYEDVDWATTRAFELHGDGTSFVRLNLAGREPHGVVAPEDYDRLCDEIAGRVRELVYAHSGSSAVEEVVRTDRLIEGPVREVLPDLCVRWGPRPLHGLHSPGLGTFEVNAEDPRTGHHTSAGFMVAKGPGIDASGGSQLGDAAHDLVDVAPTFLHLMGVESRDALRGRPIPAFCP